MVSLSQFTTALASLLICITSFANGASSSSELSSTSSFLRKNNNEVQFIKNGNGFKTNVEQDMNYIYLDQQGPANSFRTLLEGEEGHEGEDDHDHEGEDDHDHEGEEDHDHEGEEDHDHEGEEVHTSDEQKPWGIVVLSSLVVNIATLTGVIFLIPSCRRSMGGGNEDKDTILNNVIVPAFAAGALLATVVFLTLPEGISKIQSSLMEAEEGLGEEEVADGEEDHHEEHGFEISPSAIWRFATSIIAGFLIPIVLCMLFPKKAHCDIDTETKFTEDESSKEKGVIEAEVVPVKKSLDIPLIISVLFGDFCHNFADGVFIATAFMLCGNSKAWIITAITLYHEIAQEIADYFILTRNGGLKPFTALVLNFISGLSVLIGGMVVLAGSFGDMAIGVLMSIASGTYLYIAAVECLPRATNSAKSAKSYAFILCLFAVGAIPVGLTLLNHSHCSAEEGH